MSIFQFFKNLLTFRRFNRLDFQRKWCREIRGRILNVGCGEDPANLRRDFGAVNLDIAFEVTTTEGHYFNWRDKVDIIADGKQLPFRDKTFDVVVLGDVLEHDLQPYKLLREAARVSKRYIVVTVPRDERILWRMLTKPDLHWEYARHRQHCYYIDDKLLKKWFKQLKLKIVEWKETTFGKDSKTNYVMKGYCIALKVQKQERIND